MTLRPASFARTAAAAFLLGLTAAPLVATTAEDFARANGQAERYKGLADHIAVEASWVEGEHVLLYGERTAGRLQYHLYDAVTGQTTGAFDTNRLAQALGAERHAQIDPEDLRLRDSRLVEHRTVLLTRIGYDSYRCDLKAWTCAPPRDGSSDDESAREDPNAHAELRNSQTRVLASPDGKWKAAVVNYNVQLESTDNNSGKASDRKPPIVLSADGSEGNYYDFSSLAWSPDSSRLAAYRVRPGYRRTIRFVQSSPPNQLQPLYPEIPYTKPGDVLDLQQPVLFDIATKRETNIDPALFPNPFDLSGLQWWKDSRGFTFEYNQRGHQLYRVIDVSAQTGTPRVMAEESSRTFVDYRRLVPDQQDTGKIYRYDLNDGKETIWASERDNWEHLYLLNGTTGKVERQITKGDWVVRSVDRVDEEKRQIWFSASGRNPGEDPYNVHAYRIDFDGSHLVEWTPEAGNHRTGYSGDGTLMFDLVDTVQQPPVLRVRSTATQESGKELLRGDISRLLAAGWTAPEPFHAPGRDGKTEIDGVVWKPAHLDPSRHYPVVEMIYAGPQGSFVPKSFSASSQPLTDLGFVVVQIDGMGTNNRSKAFHDVAWQDLKDAGFEDRILWHKAYAASHPWYDVSRVGIFGTSAGGQNAMGALLFHPDFYKAAVANSGCHDNRMDKIWWNEQWMGWPIGPQYSASSNVDNAWRLKGKLMLVVGEMDDNVDPSSTFQVVDRLEKANKEFDLLYVPGGRHGAGGQYGQRALESFFVRNLLGESVPAWNAQPPSTTSLERR